MSFSEEVAARLQYEQHQRAQLDHQLVAQRAAQWTELVKRVLSTARSNHADPDGPLVPLPKKPEPVRVVTAPSHDFVAALYRPWEPIA